MAAPAHPRRSSRQPASAPDGGRHVSSAAERTGARTLTDLFAAVASSPGVALRRPDGEGWSDVTYRELGAAAREIAAGLRSLGIEPGDRVAILANTRAEWTILDAGALTAGTIVVPIYHTNSPGECQYVLAHSGARLVFCEDAGQLAKVAEVRDSCPALEHVVAVEGEHAGAMPLGELRARGAGAAEGAVASPSPEDPATIVYTSGTTGRPKGCVLTHANMLSTVRMYEQRLEVGPEGIQVLMFLPLAHALARVVELVVLDLGGTLTYWHGDARRILDDLAESAPTHFPSVPRIFEKVHTRALAQIEESSGPQRAIGRWALAVGERHQAARRRGEGPSALLRLQHAIADRLVLSSVRRLFGSRLRYALTGAAPISREVLDFFDACGVLVLEGYGLTESCAAATLNTPAEHRFGTVGRALPGAEVRVADDGEVLLRGPNVFPGYYRDEEETRAIFDGDWLRTGDLGEIEDGYLRITGRKKELIVTSSGKNVSPVAIESALRESRWISQAVVFGDERPYLVALITLDESETPALAEQLGIEHDPKAMAEHPKVREEIEVAVQEANRQFARIEQVKRFAIIDHDLSQATGELTPTLKVKRSVVYGRYRDLFDRLYG